MKKLQVFFLLTLVVFVFAWPVQQIMAETGSMEVTVLAKGVALPGEEKNWGIQLLTASGMQIQHKAGATGPLVESQTVTFTNVPVGNYYVYAGVSLSGSFLTMNDPWRLEYYNDAPTKDSATLIAVTKDETTKITIDLNWVTYIVVTTNPVGFEFKVNEGTFLAPHRFSWRQGESYTIKPNDFVNVIGGDRYYFKEWRNNDDQTQIYLVPSPLFRQVKDTLVARYDRYSSLNIQSRFGHPQGSGWYKIWTEVSFSVEDSVVEYVAKDSLLHLFSKWEGTEGYLAYSGRNNPAKVTLYGQTVEKAVWNDLFPLVVSVNNKTMGQVQVTPKGVWQNKDSVAIIQALPQKRYRFKNWLGASSDTAKTIKVKMDTSKTLTAIFEPLTKVDQEPTIVPKEFALQQNYPNPFNGETAIVYSLPQPGNIRLIIYNLLGREVKVLVNGYKSAGEHHLVLQADGLASGIYFLILITNEETKRIKLSLLR
ncbi:MAG: T9SS type A sorting domain-containing protein [Patescibacteria group bacterium]|nr:T9SS type A sorting domain-containing protein [Patescibacteria group bacterium]